MTTKRNTMYKIVIIEPDPQKRSQIRQTLERNMKFWFDSEIWNEKKVESEVDFTSSFEEYLGCTPKKVYHLERLSVQSFVDDLNRTENEIPQWILITDNYRDIQNLLNPDIVITNHKFYNYFIPFLKKKGSEFRYIFFQVPDCYDLVDLIQNYCSLLLEIPILTYLSTDDRLQIFPTIKDGRSNYLPYSWKNHFPDNKTQVIVRMNAVLDNVEDLAENENLYFQYDKLDGQVVQNLNAFSTKLKGKWIYLYRDKWPERSVRFTQELLALIEKASCVSSDFNQISISLLSKWSSELFGTLDLLCNQPSGTFQQSQTVEINDCQVVINYHAEQSIVNVSLTKLENAVAAWAQAEFEYCFRANNDLIDSINGILKGNAERLGKVIDAIREDLKRSSLDEKFKEEHTTALKYIQQKFDYIAGFTNCYGSGTESWHSRSIGSIVDELNSFKHLFESLDHIKKIEFTTHVDNEDKDKKVWLPDNGIFCLTNIIEAVIRNTIKHEKNSNGKYDFSLRITKEGECRFFWEASDNTTKGMDIVRKKINNPLVFDDGRIDNTSLGLKELRASIRYLHDGIHSFFNKDDSVLMYINPNDAIVNIGKGWGYRFKLRTSVPDDSSQHIKWNMDALRMANLLALCAIMARNFSHNIGSHALLSLINKVEKEMNRIKELENKAEDLKVLDNLKIVYTYIQNKADFLSSFAYAGDGIILHLENGSDIQKECQKYAYVFNKLASRTSGLDIKFNMGSELFGNDFYFSLPESGIFAVFNFIEIVLCNTRFSEICSSLLCVSFIYGLRTEILVHFAWMNKDIIYPQLYRNREIQDVALYLLGIAPFYWAAKRDHAAGGEIFCAFNLQKAKDFFFVVDKTENKKFYGFDCESLDALLKKLQDGLVIPHEFLIFVDICNKKKEDFLNAVHRNQLPFRIIDMKSEEIVIDRLKLLAKAWKNYAEQHLFNERLLDPEKKSDEEYHLIKINGKQAYSGNHGLESDPDGRLYYNEGASSVVQRRSPLYQCTQSHELTKAFRNKKRPDIWRDMESSKQNKWLCDKYAIFDYTTLPVVIIDERIQTYGSDEGLYEIWNKMHVYVPEESRYRKLDTDADLDKIVEEYLGHVCDQLKKVGLKSEFCAVIFHESLLYSWVNKQEKQGNSIVSYLQKLKEKFPQTHVYLMTGRGKSQYVKQDKENLVRFVQFTPVYTACRKENVDKYKIYNLLMSARK